MVFDTDGQFCTSFGSEHLSGPTDVVVNKDNQLLVLDSAQGCIFTFNLDGKSVGIFGTRGSGRGHFHTPRALVMGLFW